MLYVRCAGTCRQGGAKQYTQISSAAVTGRPPCRDAARFPLQHLQCLACDSAALASCSELRSLSLSCTEPEPRRLAAALAALTQLTDLDLSGCDPVILDSIGMLHPLAAAGAYGGSGGGALAALALPAAYTCDQLVRGLPQLLTASAAATAAAFALTGAGAAGTTHDAGLRRLRLQASTALPVQVAAPLLALAGLHELRLSHCGLPPALPPPALAAAAAALSSLTSLQLMQEGGSDEGGMMLADEGNDAAAEGGVRHAQPVEGASRSGWSWYELVPSWGSLQRLEITGASSLTDEHLFEMGCSLPCLTHFALSRSGGVSGAGGRGFASWPSGCRRLSSVSLYDCAGIGDEALGHIAVLPSLTCLALAHLPYVGPHGVRQLAAGATRLAVLTVERLAGAPAPALAALWRLPALESLSLRMCEVTNLSLQLALEPQTAATGAAAAAAAAVSTVAPATAAGRDGTVAAVTRGVGNVSLAEAVEAAEQQEEGVASLPAPAARLSHLDLQVVGLVTMFCTLVRRLHGASKNPCHPPAGRLAHCLLALCIARAPTRPAASQRSSCRVPCHTAYCLKPRDDADACTCTSSCPHHAMPNSPMPRHACAQGTLVTTSGLRALGRAAGLTHLNLSHCLDVNDGIVELLLAGGRGRSGGNANGDEGRGGGGIANSGAGGSGRSGAAGESGDSGGGLGAGGASGALPLLPSLVLLEVRGCSVSEAALARLAAAGIAVNTGFGAWR
mgnify:CR=1 FL=1